MKSRVPPEAFAYFVALPFAKRSYGTVADHFGVSKTAIANVAKRDQWIERAGELDRKAAEAAAQKALESVEAMNHRHLKAAMVLQGKALDALRSFPLRSAVEAVRALEIGVKQERLIRGEPTERSAVDVESVIRREYERWMPKASHAVLAVVPASSAEGTNDGDR